MSEDTGVFLHCQNKYSKSLAWAENFNKSFTDLDGKLKFSAQDSDLEYLFWQSSSLFWLKTTYIYGKEGSAMAALATVVELVAVTHSSCLLVNHIDFWIKVAVMNQDSNASDNCFCVFEYVSWNLWTMCFYIKHQKMFSINLIRFFSRLVIDL